MVLNSENNVLLEMIDRGNYNIPLRTVTCPAFILLENVVVLTLNQEDNIDRKFYA